MPVKFNVYTGMLEFLVGWIVEPIGKASHALLPLHRTRNADNYIASDQGDAVRGLI